MGIKICPNCQQSIHDLAIRCRFCKTILVGQKKTFLSEILESVLNKISVGMSQFEKWEALALEPSWGIWEVAILWGLAFGGIWWLERSELVVRWMGALREKYFVLVHEPLLQTYVFVTLDTFVFKSGILVVIVVILFLRKLKFFESMRLIWVWDARANIFAVIFLLLSIGIALGQGLDPLFGYLPTHLFFSESKWIGNPLVLISSLVVAPVTEEIFFRGFMYPVLRKRLGIILSLLLTAFLFALVHWPQLDKNFVLFTVIFFTGLFITIARYFTGSTLYAIFLHSLYNATLTGVGLIKYWREIA